MLKLWKKNEKHQKKIIAIVMALLMIAFTLPSYLGNGSGGRSNSYGSIKGGAISRFDFDQSHAEWEFIRNHALMEKQDSQGRTIAPMHLLMRKLAFRFYPFTHGDSQLDWPADLIATQMHDHQDLFLLLLTEARQMGVNAAPDEVNSIMANYSVVPPPNPNDAPLVERAVADLLTIDAALDRVASVVKITRPQIEHALVYHQSMSLNVIEYKADDYKSKAATQPAAPDVTAMYEKYKDQTPNTSPTGIGYKIPIRIKLQSLMIAHADVDKAVDRTLGPEIEIQARKIYREHPEQFAKMVVTAPMVKGNKVVPPYEEVRDEIYGQIRDQRAQAIRDAVSSEISNRLHADYEAYQHALRPDGSAPATAPATQTVEPATEAAAPMTQVGVPYDSPQYIEQLARYVESKALLDGKPIGLRPVVQTFDQWLTQADLQKLPDIGLAMLPMANGGMNFATYAMDYCTAVAPQKSWDDKTVSHFYLLQGVGPLYQPDISAFAQVDPKVKAVLLKDTDVFYFRDTAADPAHAPPEYQILDQVVEDTRMQEAMDLARADASQLLERVRKDGLLKTVAALPAGQRKPIRTTELFDAGTSSLSIPSVSPTDMPDFLKGAYDLLKNPTPGSNPDRPAGLIMLPKSRKIYLAELNELQAPWDKPSLSPADSNAQRATAEERAFAQLKTSDTITLLLNWVTYNNVVARLDFKATEVPKAPAKGQPQNPEPQQAPPPSPF